MIGRDSLHPHHRAEPVRANVLENLLRLNFRNQNLAAMVSVPGKVTSPDEE
jgi:hypothetical protein